METIALRLPSRKDLIRKAFDDLADNVRLSGTAKILALTSCHAAEQGAITVLELAKALARDRQVLVVDADLRTSPIASLCVKNSNPVGLADLLAKDVVPNDVIVPTNIEGLDLVTAGASVQNPTSLLESTVLDDFLEIAGKVYDHVLINTPPILQATDAALVAAASDAAALIVNCWSVSRTDLLSAKAQLEKSGRPILGTIVTNFSTGKRKKRRLPLLSRISRSSKK